MPPRDPTLLPPAARQVMRLADRQLSNGHLTVNEIRTHLSGPGVPALFGEFRDWIVACEKW